MRTCQYVTAYYHRFGAVPPPFPRLGNRLPDGRGEVLCGDIAVYRVKGWMPGTGKITAYACNPHLGGVVQMVGIIWQPVKVSVLKRHLRGLK